MCESHGICRLDGTDTMNKLDYHVMTLTPAVTFIDSWISGLFVLLKTIMIMILEGNLLLVKCNRPWNCYTPKKILLLV
jgi:hypothetical protein